jgi:hypothetical protein
VEKKNNRRNSREKRIKTPKAWSSGKKIGFESERSRIRAPLVSLEGGKVFPALDWSTIPSP